MNKRALILICFSTFFLFCIGCSEDKNPSEPESETITVTFTEDWHNPLAGEGYIFYSDISGTGLWDSSWNGNAVLTVNSTNFPDRVSMTTVVEQLFDKSTDIMITTNYNIKPESWILRGNLYRWPEIVGDCTLELQNIPNHQGYMVSSKLATRSSRTGTIFSPFSTDLFTSPDKMFIRLNTDSNGPQYMWVNNVTVGGTYNVDLSGLLTMQSKIISLPTAGEEINFSVRAYINDYYSGVYRIDGTFGLYYDQLSNTFTAYYPAGEFTGYRTVLYINEESYPTNNYWYHSAIGNIPESMSKINADFEFISTSPTNFEIDAVGDFHATGSYWIYDDGNGNTYRWNVYSAYEEYSLPEIPSNIKSKYPTLQRNMFELISANVVKHDGLSSYDELIDNMFLQGKKYYTFVNGQLSRTKDPNGLRP